jgi:hypothetical protein
MMVESMVFRRYVSCFSGRTRDFPFYSQQDSQLVQVLQQVGDGAVHAERPRVVQFLFTVAAGQHAHTHHAGSAGGDMVPDGVTDGDAFRRRDAELLKSRQKEVRLRLALQLPLSFHNHRLRPNANGVQGGVDERPVARRGDGVRNSRGAQSAEHFDGARQWPRVGHYLPEKLSMSAVHGLHFFRGQLATGFALGETDDEVAA